MRLIAVLLLSLGMASATSLAAPGKQISVPDGWEGSTYTDEAGQFSHCAASAPYVSGTILVVSIDRAFQWHLGFYNEAWKMMADAQVSTIIQIDNSPGSEFIATAYDSSFLRIDMPTDDQGMINSFRFGRVMRIKFNAWQHHQDGSLRSTPSNYEFELKGTSVLLRVLAQCVQDQLTPPKVAKAPEPKPKKVAKPAEKPAAKEETKKPKEPETFSGTGVIVSEAGLILTNNHVVEGCTSISFSMEGELARKASILRTDKTNDLALLKTDQQFKPDAVANFRIAPSMKAGEQIAVYGFPLSGLLSVSGNVVSGNISSLAGLGDDVRFYQISAPVQPGNSGGPLLDYSGNVVGIVTSRIDDFVVAGATGSLPQNVNFSIKSQIATSFMDTHGVEYQVDVKSDKGDLAAVVDAAKKFTVFIECKR